MSTPTADGLREYQQNYIRNDNELVQEYCKLIQSQVDELLRSDRLQRAIRIDPSMNCYKLELPEWNPFWSIAVQKL